MLIASDQEVQAIPCSEVKFESYG